MPWKLTCIFRFSTQAFVFEFQKCFVYRIYHTFDKKNMFIDRWLGLLAGACSVQLVLAIGKLLPWITVKIRQSRDSSWCSSLTSISRTLVSSLTRKIFDFFCITFLSISFLLCIRFSWRSARLPLSLPAGHRISGENEAILGKGC